MEKQKAMQLLLKSHFVLTLILLICQSAFAQLPDKRSQQKDERDFRAPLRSAFEQDEARQKLQRKLPSELDLQMQALEGAIDPDDYIVGPGDIFRISIWTAEEVPLQVPVTPEGKLVIPTIGILEINGKSLSEVQRIVREAGAKKYLQAAITANLAYLRSFRVHVTGQVMNPGPYTALAISRVSDLIEEAGGLTNWGAERAIEVRRADGTVHEVDLYRYTKLGELSSNIYLRGGDVVYVPSIKLTGATVRVEGLVNDPGIYQLAENETLTDFLLRVDALNRRADLKNAYLERTNGANGTSEVIAVFPYLEKQANGYSDLILQDGDVIMVPQRQEEVYVIGAVRNPGPYPYIPNQKVRDYVGLAGSDFQAADLSKSKVIRRGSNEQQKGEDLWVGPGDTVFVPQKVRFGVTEITSIVGTLTGIIISLAAVGVIE